MSEKTKNKVATKTENRFTKQQVLASKKLPYSKDLINAILQEDKTYTLKEVESEINKFLKKRVN